MTASTATTETPPSRVVAGRYRLRSQLGRGGAGVVWAATDELLSRDVAVKEVVLPYISHGADPQEREVLLERAMREARAAARLQHPALVSVYDVVQDDDRPWIVMELVEARSLAQVVRDDGPLPVAQVADIGLQVLAGLESAHRAGIVHRDVKPGNVLLCADGRARLTDFGIAWSAGDPHLTQTGVLLGSPAYIAPERARGMAGGTSADLWALASTLYTCVEGYPAYEGGDAFEVLTAVVETRRRPAQRAGDLEALLADVLDRSEATRPRAHEVRRRLTALAAAHERMVDLAGPATLVLPAAVAVGSAVEDAPGGPGQAGAAAVPARPTTSTAAARATRATPTRHGDSATSALLLSDIPLLVDDGRSDRSAWPWVLVVVLLVIAGTAAAVAFLVLMH